MRIGLGLHITQQRRLPYPTVAVLPDDAVGALGDGVYFNGVVYRKRWVGNREGVGDGILFPINLFPSVGNFDFECMIRLDTAIDDYLLLATSSPDVNSAIHFRINGSTGRQETILRSSAGIAQHLTLSSTNIPSTWSALRTTRVGNAVTSYLNGVAVAFTADTSGWSPSLTQTGTSILRALSTSSISIKACNFRLTAPGGTITARLDEGAGTTINNSTGANGTLTDASPANFWHQSWVPE
jgi:hypothetical protein